MEQTIRIDRLTFGRVQPHVKSSAAGSVTALNPMLLLEHPDVDLSRLVTAPPILIEGDIETVTRSLGIRLHQRGLSEPTRRAVVAEVSHLARLTASLGLRRDIAVQIGRRAELLSSVPTSKGNNESAIRLVQRLEQHDLDSAAEVYLRSVENPEDPNPEVGGAALVCWGTIEETAATMRSFAQLAGSGERDELLVAITAEDSSIASLHGQESGDGGADSFSRDDRSSPVVLVSAPFAPLKCPSLGLSTLSETVTEPKPRAVYLTIPFSAAVGFSLYDWVASGKPTYENLVGDWIFSRQLGGSRVRDGFLSEVLCGGTLAWFGIDAGKESHFDIVPLAAVNEVVAMVEQASLSIERWVSEIGTLEPRIVGFSTLFQQNTASLALARRLKETFPGILTLFGGANCEGEMGAALHRCFPFIDVVVSGEAEVVFPKIVNSLLNGGGSLDLAGVRARSTYEGSAHTPLENAPRSQMDDLPRPDYSDYVRQWQQSEINEALRPALLFESSRGCWWGAKSHCTFCGLNGESMVYRSKSADTVIDEIRWLASEYPGYELAAVDNIIDMAYFSTVLRDLAKLDLPLELFYEVKANLNERQVAILSQAGVRRIQPGIESFSDHVLDLMAKGVSGLQNIQLLKWCAQYGVTPYWNLLWGFPGESEEDYLKMSEMIPLLGHFTPPISEGAIRLDRFSPNHSSPEHFGFSGVRPARAYDYIYRDQSPEDITGLAYYFDYEYGKAREPGLEEAIEILLGRVTDWRAEHEASRLVHFVTDQGVMVFDGRSCAKSKVHRLEGDARTVFETCQSIHPIRQLEERMRAARAHAAIGKLEEQRLLLRDNGRALSLSLPGGRLVKT